MTDENILSSIISDSDHNDLVNNGEFSVHGCQYTILYMSRIHSQAEFILAKIILLRNKLFSDYEVSEIVEAFTVKTLCDWEWYVERMLCQCLMQDTAKLSEYLALELPKKITRDEAEAYLNGLGYFDLKSASSLKALSKNIIMESLNPFVNLDNRARDRIDDFYIIRNYVAHKSNKAKRALNRIYLKYHQHSFVEVGEFLLGKMDAKDSSIRFQEFGSCFWLAGFNILEFLYPKTYKWIAQEEKIYNDKCHLRFLYLMSLAPNRPA